MSYELREELAGEDGPVLGEYSEEEWVARFMQEFDAEEVTGEWEPEASVQNGEHGVQPVISNEKGA